EAGKAALVLGDQLRLERPGAVAWHINAQRTIAGQHRLAAASVAAVAAPTLGVGQVKAQLGPQRPLDHGLLELLENGLDPGRIHRARDQLLKKFRGQIDGRRDHRRLLLAWHTCSLVASWYASHTKFLTPSVGHVHAAELAPPQVERRVTETVLAAKLLDRRAGGRLLQEADDLFFGVSLLHVRPLVRRTLLRSDWPGYRGAGHGRSPRHLRSDSSEGRLIWKVPVCAAPWE